MGEWSTAERSLIRSQSPLAAAHDDHEFDLRAQIALGLFESISSWRSVDESRVVRPTDRGFAFDLESSRAHLPRLPVAAHPRNAADFEPCRAIRGGLQLVRSGGLLFFLRASEECRTNEQQREENARFRESHGAGCYHFSEQIFASSMRASTASIFVSHEHMKRALHPARKE